MIWIPIAIAVGALALILNQEPLSDRIRNLPKLPATPTPKLARALANKWGAVWRIPPSVVLTIMDIESKFVPLAVNTDDPRAAKSGGAWGLMQITYKTAPDLVKWARKSKEKNAREVLEKKWHGRPEDLLDPELNVMLGSFYLARLWKEFGNLEMTAAAYQSGPNKVRKRKVGQHGRDYVAMFRATYPRHASSSGQWWLPTPFGIARHVLLKSKPAHAADVHAIDVRKPISSGNSSVVTLANTASEKLGRAVDPRAVVLAATMATQSGKPLAERAAAAHIVVNRAKAENKRIFELAAPDGKLGRKGDAGRIFASNAIPTLEEVQIAEKIMAGQIGDPTGGKTSLGWN